MDIIAYTNKFAEKYNVSLEILKKFKEKSNWDNKLHWKFQFKLKRGNKSYTAIFTQSISANDKKPTLYDILSCLTIFDPEDFEWFCKTYGYDKNKRENKIIYNGCIKEWKAVQRLFGDCLDELREIS